MYVEKATIMLVWRENVSCSYLIELMFLEFNRFIPPLVVLAPHDPNVAVYVQPY